MQEAAIGLRRLFGDRRSVGEMCQVFIAGLVQAVCCDEQRTRICVSPNLRVSVSEVQGKAVAMSMIGNCGKIEPDPGRWVCNKETIVNAPFVFVEQNPHF